VAAFDVAFRRQKWLLCLQALLAAHATDGSWHPKTLVRLVRLYTAAAPAAVGVVASFLENGKAVLFQGLNDIAAILKHVAATHTSLEWQVAVAEAESLAHGSFKAGTVALWLQDKGASSLGVYETAVRVVEKYGSQKDQDAFKQTAKTWFPYATLFGNKYDMK
ncbi:hypothetical protein DYB26_013369, partial [Aphanomyces astaci]